MSKIYISSTYDDLKDHRKVVYDELHKLGHKVLAMEQYIATDQRPLDKCLKDVDWCDIYIGIFALRYGYVPEGREESITELEFRHAGEKGKSRLIFLLDKKAAWPTEYMDAITGENNQGQRISEFRSFLQKEFLSSFFISPDQLAIRVITAVALQEAEEQRKSIVIPETKDLSIYEGSGAPEIEDRLMEAIWNTKEVRLAQLDLRDGNYWWSTRLFVLAALAAEYTKMEQIIFVEHENKFIGMAAPSAVREALAQIFPKVHEVYKNVKAHKNIKVRYGQSAQSLPNLIRNLLSSFLREVNDLAPGGEKEAKEFVQTKFLKRWLGQSLNSNCIKVESTHDFDLPTLASKILEYPSTFVPLVQEGTLFRVVDQTDFALRFSKTILKQQLKN